jgi:hypothetical protein
MHLTIGRVGRQVLTVCAISVALVAAVLGLGSYAVSHLGGSPAPSQYAGTGPAGVYRVVTPNPAAPFTAVDARPHKTFVTAPAVALATFRPAAPALAPAPATATPATATRAPARATASSKRRAAKRKAAKRKAAKQRARRRAASKRTPAPAAQPVAAVASVAPAARRPNPNSLTRGNSGKPKVNGPRATPPGLSRGHGHGAKPKLLQAAPAPAPPAAPPARGNHGRGKGAIGHGPPPHANHGNGHASPPPGQLLPKAHGKGH